MEKGIPLDHVALFRAFSTSPDSNSTPKTIFHSLSPKERQTRILEEQKKAKEHRKAQEISRPKYILKEFSPGHCKPAEYFIALAREKRLKSMTRPRSAVVRVKRGLNSPVRRETQVQVRGKGEESPGSTMKTGTCSPNRKEMTDALPEWVLQRTDFLPNYTRIKEGQGINLFDVCRFPRAQRKEAELNALITYTLSLSSFPPLPRAVLKDLCGKYQAATAPKDSISKLYSVGKQGEIGDAVYIVYTGQVEVCVDGEVIESTGEKTVIALESLTCEPQKHTIIAKTDLEMIKLTQTDYDTAILGIRNKEKNELTEFLGEIPYFSQWQVVKLHRLSSVLVPLVVGTGQCVYEKGDQSECLYVVRSGKVEIQTIVDLDESYRWPVGSHAWEISCLEKKVVYRLQVAGPGCLFGDFEMIPGIPRLTRAKSISRSSLLSLSRDEFSKIFTQREAESLLQYTNLTLPNTQDLTEKVQETFQNQRNMVKFRQEKALLMGYVLDYSGLTARDCLLDRKTRKMKGWIQNLQRKKSENKVNCGTEVLKVSKNRVVVSSVAGLRGTDSRKNTPSRGK